MNDMDEKQLIDDLEKESMLELEVMHESENTDNERIIEDAKSKIEKLFDDVRDLLKDASDPEKVKEALSQAKEYAKDILSSTKDKVVEVSESEQFKQTMSAGKEFLQGTAGLVVEGFKYGKETLRKNDSLRKVIDKADEKVDEIRTNDSVIRAVDKAEEVTGKATEALFSGLKKIFNKGDE